MRKWMLPVMVGLGLLSACGGTTSTTSTGGSGDTATGGVTVTNTVQQEGSAGAIVVSGSENYRAAISGSPTTLRTTLSSENYTLTSQTAQVYKTQLQNTSASQINNINNDAERVKR